MSCYRSLNLPALASLSQGTDAMEEVEVLMERMKLLQECQLEEEGVTREEMETCFEMEKTESLLVTPSGKAKEQYLLGLKVPWQKDC